MKKLVALLLSASMLIGLSACSNSDSSKKKNRSKFTMAETSEVISTETDLTIPSISDTDPTDTVPTDTEPSDTDPTVPGMPVSHDLSQILVDHNPEVRMYGAIDPTQESEFGEMVGSEFLYLDELVFVDQDDQAVLNYQKALSDIYDAQHDPLARKYEDYLNRFCQYQEEGQTLPNEVFISSSNIFRCDTEILSVAMNNKTLTQENYGGNFDIECHNFRASDGSRIEISDVIKNPDALLNYLENMYPEDDDICENVASRIGHSDPIMALTYDGVIFPEYWVKVPVTEVPDAFDMKYFFNTPDVYSLYLDNFHRLDWDFDGDGDFEVLECSLQQKDYVVSELDITLDGQTYGFTTNEIPSLGYAKDFRNELSHMVSFTETGKYILLTLAKDFLTDVIYVFRIGPDGIEYLNEILDTRPLDVYDPTHMYVVKSNYVLNRSTLYGTYTLNEDGSLSEYTIMQMMCAGPFVLKQDLVVKELDEASWSVGDEITLKKDTPVSFYSYDPYQHTLLMEVLHPDDSDNFIVYAKIDEDNRTISDLPLKEVFAGFRHDY